MIVWYEYCRINEQRIDMGGYADTENPGFMWAETQLAETDLQGKSCGALLDEIAGMREEHAEVDLYPEFYLSGL